MGNKDVRRGRGVAGVLALIVLAGCSSSGNWFGSSSSSATATASAPSSSGSFTERFSNLVLGTPATAKAEGPRPDDLDCPNVDIRQGASTLSASGPDTGSAALSVRYQASFVRTARECAQHGGNVTMKVGVEGRVILGPAGAPGQITIPLRLALVKEGIEPKTIWTKLYSLPVTLPPGQTNVPFIHVEEDMTVPMPSAKEFDNYVIYVGFDPEGAALEKKKPAPRSAHKGQRPR
jgi:hypothetical protein